MTGTLDADDARYIRERYGDSVAVIRRTRELAAAFGVSRALPPAARALKAHPRLDLYVGPDSPHPLADYGCTICHGGMGIGTSFRSAAHSPGDAATRKRWEAEYGWSPVESWPRPMLPVRYVEASCAKCHYGADRVRGAPTLSRGLELASELGCCNCHPFGGSSPFEWVGRVGWDLRRISTKTTPGWTTDFLMDPTAFRPASRMPRFFGIGRKGQAAAGAAPDASGIEYAEALCIAEFLFAVSTAAPADTAGAWTGTGADAEADRDTGREVFRTVGCLGCHSVASPDLRCELSDFGPDLSRAGDKTSARWLRSWLRSPAAYWAETRMPSMRLSEPEAAAIAVWIAESLRSGKPAAPGPPLPPARLLEALAADTGDGVIGPEAGGEAGETGWRPAAKAAGDGRPGVPAGPTDADSSLRVKAIAAGRRLARLYGCFACHAISGMYDEPKPGPDHGTAGDKYIGEIQFGDTDMPRTRWDYFSKKIADPRAFETDSPRGASRLRMPKFRLSDRDIHALTTMLLSFTTERVPESRRRRPSPADSPALLGERAIRRLNCAGCHLIGLEETIVPLAEMSDRKGRRELERRGGWIAPDIFRSPDGLLFAGAGTALSSQVMAVLSGEVLRTGLPLRQAWDACAPGRLDAAGPAQRRRLLADLRIAICAAGLEAILDAGANVRAKDLAVATGADRNVAGPANAAWSLCGARPASDVRPAIGVRVRIVTGEAAIRASGAFDRLQDAPPSLAFEGGKARPGWLYGFLRDPGQQNLRPGLKVRMPSFFLPSSSVPGATGDLKPGTGTEVPARGRSGGPSGGKAPAVYRAGRLAADPSRLPGGGDEVAHIVEYFLKAAGAGRFEPPRPPRIDPEKYRRGAYLLGRGPGRFGCTDCHPAGGSRPGGPRSDWGSDLADVRLRLREDWLRRFLRQPAAFYPWTNMPSSFYSFANYRETEEDATRAIFRRADNPEEPLRGKAASEEAARINEAVDALIHYLLHAGEAEIRLPE